MPHFTAKSSINTTTLALFFGAIIVSVISYFIISSSHQAAHAQSAETLCSTTITGGADVANTFNSMTAGQTLCLNGVFSTGAISLTASGVTLASEPGQTATILGKINIRGNDIKVTNLAIDGQGNNSGTFLVYNGTRNNVIQNNDITSTAPDPSQPDDSRQGNCIILGESGATSTNGPQYTVIDKNRIHNCGQGKFDQGLYIAGSRYTKITNNYIYDNPMFGMQLYPDADDATIEYNIFDNNAAGVTFSGESQKASDRNIFRKNIVSNSTHPTFNNINYYWGGAIGVGNIADSNCLYNGTPGNFQVPYTGYSVTGTNVLDSDPLYVDRAQKNYSLQETSPCLSMGPRSDDNPPEPQPEPEPPISQSPYPLGSPSTLLPGKIELEKYDIGGQSIAYNDTTPGNQGGSYRSDDVDIISSGSGYALSSTALSEWLEYTSSSQSGKYTISVRAANTKASSIRLVYDGVTISNISLAKSGSMTQWKTTTIKSISIPSATNKVLRVEITGQPVNLDYITFTRTGN